MLGATMRIVELNDEVLDTLLTVSIEEYSAYINEWLIQQQWTTLQNLHIDSTDILSALTTKTLDFERSFTYAYSKQAGHNAGNVDELPWELKKDYVLITGTTDANGCFNYQQIYNIPKGREINEVLWVTPSQVGSYGSGLDYLSSPYGGFSAGAYGWNYGGVGMGSVLPAFSMYISTQDVKMKKNILQSELTYRVTAGPNGTKNLHLYPIPNSNDMIKGAGHSNYNGYAVWYWYYDTSTKDRDLCLEENNDVIKLPTDVPLNNIPWGKLNDSAKSRVRRLLIAEAKSVLAHIRGKYNGKIVGRGEEDGEMDYSYLLDQAKEDKAEVYDKLSEYLNKLTYREIMEDRASISENVKKVMENTPSIQSIFMI